MRRAATRADGDAEVVSTGCVGVGVLEGVEKKYLERTPMKRYLKFAASFWVSAFLAAGSMATAQSTSTSAVTAKAKKNNGSSTANSTTNSSSQTQSGSTTAATTQTPATVTAHDAQGTTTTTTTKPKTMIGPDKTTIVLPQL